MISFIIVNYKNEDTLYSCIKSLEKNILPKYREILVFNNDKKLINSLSNIERLTVIENGKNLGFGKACNEASRLSKGEYLFFINPDAKIISGNINKFISILDDKNIGIISPEILSAEGVTEKWNYGKKITPLQIFLNNIFPSKYSSFKTNNPAWVSGAAFAMKKSVFKKIGMFDERFFMYFEDVDLCKRVVETGMLIKKSSDLKVVHFGGKSFSDKKNQKRLYFNSQDIYLEKHFGKFWPFLFKIIRIFYK